MVTFDGPAPTNLFIVSIDTLRWDRIGRYGGGDQSPYIDLLLAGGVTLGRHRSCSNWTYPSMLCILTGNTGAEIETLPVGGTGPYLSPSQPTLADFLRDEGYQSSLVATNGFVGLTPYELSNRFDQSLLYRYDTIDTVAPVILQEAEALLDGKAPFYLHAHLMDVHTPYYMHKGFTDIVDKDMLEVFDESNVETWALLTPAEQEALLLEINALYDGEIRYLDQRLQELFVDLDALGALDDTLVVFVSDHGEQFQEHDWWLHAKTLYGEETRALMGFWSKNIVPASLPYNTGHSDVVPTIMAALGLAEPPEVGGVVMGMRMPDEPIFSYHVIPKGGSVAVDVDGERLLFDLRTGSLEYYVDDPFEVHNLGLIDRKAALALFETHLRAEAERTADILGISMAEP